MKHYHNRASYGLVYVKAPRWRVKIEPLFRLQRRISDAMAERRGRREEKRIVRW
jgi:hypothetical protein